LSTQASLRHSSSVSSGVTVSHGVRRNRYGGRVRNSGGLREVRNGLRRVSRLEDGIVSFEKGFSFRRTVKRELLEDGDEGMPLVCGETNS
jgi:hypothetical protein